MVNWRIWNKPSKIWIVNVIHKGSKNEAESTIKISNNLGRTRAGSSGKENEKANGVLYGPKTYQEALHSVPEKLEVLDSEPIFPVTYGKGERTGTNLFDLWIPTNETE
ncbi:hypothetical protein V6N11_065262 [Hibiscus sabdariffa]|uniref:Uncharacterized protein n=1 Tax=Hibiscus sabdariffa TaxID=183260 RepID=A0ABR2QGU7_9ROSI